MKKRLKKYLFTILSLLLILNVAACGTDKQKQESGKVKVATTAFALKDFIEKIGGDEVEVVFSLEGNPHHFELTQSDASNIMQADLFINIPYGDYASIGDQIEKVNEKMKVVNLSTQQPLEVVETDGHEHEELISGNVAHDEEMMHGYDPHIWLDPKRAEELVDQITEALKSADPNKTQLFEEHEANLIAQLKKLDQKMSAGLKKFKGNTMLVSHAAYGYLADRYGLIQESVNSVSDQSENTQKAMIALDNLIKSKKIQTIFTEKNIESNSSVEILQKQNKLVAHTLYNLETPPSAGEDYFSIMEANLEQLIAGL